MARSTRARQELAKSWLLEILERTPVSELEEVPVAWIAREGPRLINDILRGLGGPTGAVELELGTDGIERIAALTNLRRGDGAPARLARDLAALQSLLVEALRRDVPERQLGAFAGSVGQLAEVFGSLQAQLTESLMRGRDGDAAADQLTGLPGAARLSEWTRLLLAEHRRYSHPFTLLLIEIEGLERINEAYGDEAGNRMVAAVAAVIGRQVRAVDRSFRLGEDEFAVLSPHQGAAAVRPLAERLIEVIDRSQDADGPRIAIVAGIASCPEHGESADQLLAVAVEATYAAKAAGVGVADATG